MLVWRQPGPLPLERVGRERNPSTIGRAGNELPVEGNTAGPQPSQRLKGHNLIRSVLLRVAHGRGGHRRLDRVMGIDERGQRSTRSQLDKGHRTLGPGRFQAAREQDGLTDLTGPERRVGGLGIRQAPAGDA